MKAWISTIIASCAVVILSAQPVKEVPPYMNIEVADEHLAINDYYRALEYYEIAYKQEKSDELAYKIGMLHFKLRDYKRAERWLSRVIRNDINGTKHISWLRLQAGKQYSYPASTEIQNGFFHGI